MKLEKGKKVNLKSKGLAFGALVMLFVATMAFAGTVTATDPDEGSEIIVSMDGGKLSPDWKMVAFIKGHDLYVMDLEGSSKKIAESEVSYIQHCVWSPEGEKIAYCDVYNLWVVNKDGGNRVKIATMDDRYKFRYFFSPDEKKLAYYSKNGLWTVNADGSNNARIAADPSIEELLWSPTGRRIFYKTLRGWFLITSDGSDNKPFGRGTPLIWVSEKKILVQDDNRLNIFDVDRLEEEGYWGESVIDLSKVAELDLAYPYDIHGIIISPDSKKIALQFREESWPRLIKYVILNLDGNNLDLLVFPARILSPDFKKTAYVDSETAWVKEKGEFVSTGNVWIMDVDGRNQKKIAEGLPLSPPPLQPGVTPTPISPDAPSFLRIYSWSPDGSKVAYIVGDELHIITVGKAALKTPTPTPTQTATPTSKPVLTSDEDPFNYQGEYTLDVNELTDEEKAALVYVMKYAKEYKVSPCFIMAVIRQESSFKADVNGGADVGYMQVTYDAAQDGGYKGAEQEWQEKDGLDPDQNIQYGTKYLMALNYIFSEGKLLIGELKATKVPDTTERLKFVLAAYNGGAGRIATAQQLCKEEGDDPEKWDDVKNYLEAAGATSEKAEIIQKYVEQVIEGRDLTEGQRRGYEFFLTIRIPATGATMPGEGVPGFEAIFAIGGLLVVVTYLLRRRKKGG